jgi:hypothetical protein
MGAHAKKHLTFANVASGIALFIALGLGTAWAVERNSIKSKHIVNGQVKGADVNEDTLGAVPLASDSDALGGDQADRFATAFTVDGFLSEGDPATSVVADVPGFGEVEMECLDGADEELRIHNTSGGQLEINITSHDAAGNEIHFRENPVSAGETRPESGVAVGNLDSGQESVTIQLIRGSDDPISVATIIGVVGSAPANCLLRGQAFVSD